MIEIFIDLKHEFNILNQATWTADLRRKAKEIQHCFIKQDQHCRELLKWTICLWDTQACVEQTNGLVPLTVKDLSNAQKENYHVQRSYYQRIANEYTAWYSCWWECLHDCNSTYYYAEPWKINLKSLQVLPKISSMGSWQKLDSLAILVIAHLPRILYNNSCLTLVTNAGTMLN